MTDRRIKLYIPKNEEESVRKWINNQKNISASLRMAIKLVIEMFGEDDLLDRRFDLLKDPLIATKDLKTSTQSEKDPKNNVSKKSHVHSSPSISQTTDNDDLPKKQVHKPKTASHEDQEQFVFLKNKESDYDDI